jgi:hypothetical protein
MNLTISIFCVFLLVISIGAPPVVEKVNKDKEAAKADTSDEVVRDNNLFFDINFINLFSVKRS